MPTAAPHFLSVLASLLLLVLPAHGQDGELPFAPDSIYHRYASTSEQMLGGQAIPTRLSAAEWRADLDTLAAAIRRRIPYADAATGPRHLTQRLDSLKRAVGGQTRDQRILSVLRLANLSAAGTGHTGVRIGQRAIGWRALPLWPYTFADGVYIMSAANPDLIGQELLAIGGTPIDSVYAAVAPYVSADNRTHRRHQPVLFRYANPLKALGIVETIDSIAVRVRPPNGPARTVHVSSLRPDSPAYVRFVTSPDTRPVVPPERTWSPASVLQKFDPTDNVRPYKISYDDATDLLVLELNAVLNESDIGVSDLSFADLADSLRTIVDTRPLDKMVIDLRTNSGGNATLIEPLVDLLSTHPKIDRRGTLYTLIAPTTYSAAGLLAMELERRTKTLFAGGPSGFAPNIWGETAPALLPNSKITVNLSYAYYEGGLPGDPRTHLTADLPVPLTMEQHAENVDAAMIAVKQHDPPPRPTTSLSPADRRWFTGTYRLSPIHVAHIRSTQTGLRLRIDAEGPEPFLTSDLHPLSTTRLATDIRDAVLERRPGVEGLRLVWKDTTYALSPADAAAKTPHQHLRAGHFDQGAAALRAARAAGVKLGTDLVEYPFTSRVAALLQQDQPETALRYATLAVDFVPMSWRAQAYLANTQKAAGCPEAAVRAFRRVLALDPTLPLADAVRQEIRALEKQHNNATR
ncbi:hypothetical protein [Longibacter sp.]|uniref:hypothetical protein n=1 Tax=Longibacter sp. TaxID=2045415 RepID=UPI003EB852E1